VVLSVALVATGVVALVFRAARETDRVRAPLY
jgi:hypothetical protein